MPSFNCFGWGPINSADFIPSKNEHRMNKRLSHFAFSGFMACKLIYTQQFFSVHSNGHCHKNSNLARLVYCSFRGRACSRPPWLAVRVVKRGTEGNTLPRDTAHTSPQTRRKSEKIMGTRYFLLVLYRLLRANSGFSSPNLPQAVQFPRDAKFCKL